MAIVVAMVSGGLKSAVAAAESANENQIILLHVDYGQPSAKAQRRAVRALASAFPKARSATIELPYVAGFERQSRTEDIVSSAGGSTEAEATATVSALGVRGLLPVLASVATHCALRFGAQVVTTGVTDADHESSPLTSFAEGQPGRMREFLQTFNMMVETALPERSRLHIEAPLVDLTYPEVIKLGARFELPLELTWSCEAGGPTPCMACPSCGARVRAFANARLTDPLMTQTGT